MSGFTSASPEVWKNKRRVMRRDIPIERSKGTVSVPERLRVLDATQRHAVLATCPEGGLHTSLIAFALTPDVKGLLFATPKRTLKYRNILKHNAVSLLIAHVPIPRATT